MMEKLCCFPSASEGPSLDVEVKCVTTCCVHQAKAIEVDFADGEDREEEKLDNVKDVSEESDKVSFCCLTCKKKTRKERDKVKNKNE